MSTVRVSQPVSCFSCELRIKRVKNIDYLKSNRQVFVRCYLYDGNNNRVRLETQEISSKSNFLFNYSSSLNCFGGQDSMAKLMEAGTVVFELRQRKTPHFIGKVGSNLLAKAEIPWKSVFQTPEMEIEKWVFMVPKSRRRGNEDEKPPALEVGMKVQVPAVEETVARRRRQCRERKWDECGCGGGDGCSCGDYELFALAAALEGF